MVKTNSLDEYKATTVALENEYQAIANARSNNWDQVHMLWSKINNLSRSEEAWKVNKLKAGPELNNAIHKRILLYSEIHNFVKLAVIDNPSLPFDKDGLAVIENLLFNWRLEFEFVPPTDEEVQKAEEMLEIPIEPIVREATQEEFIEVKTKLQKKSETKQKKIARRLEKKQAKDTIFAEPSLKAGLEIPMEPGNYSHIFNIPPVFPTERNKNTPLVYSPAVKAPFIGNKKVTLEKANETRDNKDIVVEWREIVPESFITLNSLTRDEASQLCAHCIFPVKILDPLLAKLGEIPKIVGDLGVKEAIESYGIKAVINARVLYYWAKSIALLRTAELTNKISFWDLWFERLCDVPEGLDASHAAAQAYLAIRFAIRSEDKTTAINKTMNGFKMGQLATRKVGETTDSLIQRCEKSVRYYWGVDSKQYIEEYLKTPEGQEKVKQAYHSRVYSRLMTSRAAVSEKVTQNSALFSEKVKKGLSAVQEILEEVKAVDEDIEMSWLQRSNFRFRTFIANLKTPGKAVNLTALQVRSKATSIWEGFTGGLATLKTNIFKIAEKAIVKDYFVNDDGLDDCNLTWFGWVVASPFIMPLAAWYKFTEFLAVAWDCGYHVPRPSWLFTKQGIWRDYPSK